MNPVTRAQAKAEREHNAGEVRVCGGCRWLNDKAGLTVGGWCTAPVPMWVEPQLHNAYPNDDATDCEAYESK